MNDATRAQCRSTSSTDDAKTRATVACASGCCTPVERGASFAEGSHAWNSRFLAKLVRSGHEATDTGLAYAPVSQAHGHHHTQFNVLPCCTAAQTRSVPSCDRGRGGGLQFSSGPQPPRPGQGGSEEEGGGVRPNT